MQQFGYVALVVRAGHIRGQQVATHGVVPKRQKRIAHPS
jgi:hypothetical protein